MIAPPADKPYGQRQYTVEDLEGHRWSFSEQVRDVLPEEWGASRPGLGDGLDAGNPRLWLSRAPARSLWETQLVARRTRLWSGRWTSTGRAPLGRPRVGYAEDELAYRERERIFSSGWSYATAADRVSEPGSYAVAPLGHASVVLVRDRAGELRAFKNVCQHRGHEIASGAVPAAR